MSYRTAGLRGSTRNTSSDSVKPCSCSRQFSSSLIIVSVDALRQLSIHSLPLGQDRSCSRNICIAVHTVCRLESTDNTISGNATSRNSRHHRHRHCWGVAASQPAWADWLWSLALLSPAVHCSGSRGGERSFAQSARPDAYCSLFLRQCRPCASRRCWSATLRPSAAALTRSQSSAAPCHRAAPALPCRMHVPPAPQLHRREIFQGCGSVHGCRFQLSSSGLHEPSSRHGIGLCVADPTAHGQRPTVPSHAQQQ
jgi:hypothetical protein